MTHDPAGNQSHSVITEHVHHFVIDESLRQRTCVTDPDQPHPMELVLNIHGHGHVEGHRDPLDLHAACPIEARRGGGTLG